MRDAPQGDRRGIRRCLERHWGIRAADLAFLPVGYDPQSWAFRATSGDDAWFVTVRRGGA